jgi:hypothetical protein
LDALKTKGWTIAKCVKPEYCIHDEKPDYDYIRCASSLD